MEQAAVRLDFVTEDFENTATGQLLRSVKAFAAELEREKIVERTMRGKRERARSGRLPIVGDGHNTVDLTFIDNAAWAHLDAASAMDSHTAACAGKAYFISNAEPVKLWVWFNDFLPRVGAPPIRRQISLRVATLIGAVMEWIWAIFRLQGDPRMTRFMAAALARSHWYDMGPAKRDFGYNIRVDMATATERTATWMKAQSDNSSRSN